jgi:hypothetical protein
VSLISEGLKKAHLEALRQDRQQRRVYLGSGRVDVPARNHSALALISAALIGASIVLAVTAYWISRESAPVTRPEASATPAALTPVKRATPVASRAAAQAPAPARAKTGRPAKAEIVAPISSSVSPAKVREQVRPRSTTVAQPDVEDEAATILRPDERDPAPSGRVRDHLRDGQTYASPLSAPGGVEVSLSGISSSGGESVAIMNGNVVRAGSNVGPFVVERIERGRVLLRYIDVRVWMTY